MATPAPTDDRHARDWLLFAAIIIGITGALNIVYGVAALGDSSFFVAHPKFIAGNLHTWGAVLLAVGVLEILAAYSIPRHGAFGRWFGLAVASLGLAGSLLALPAHPAWGIATFALHILVIYGLAVYGGRGLAANMAALAQYDEDDEIRG
jgi:hypothetical protein